MESRLRVARTHGHLSPSIRTLAAHKDRTVVVDQEPLKAGLNALKCIVITLRKNDIIYIDIAVQVAVIVELSYD